MKSSIHILAVSDLHRRKILYQGLDAAVRAHAPNVVALVGDFLDAGEVCVEQFTTEECANFLGALPCERIVFVRGNHEDRAWHTFAAVWKSTGRSLNALHGTPFVYGPLVLVGFPCLMGDDRAFTCNRQNLPSNHEIWLSRLVNEFGSGAKAIWLMHEPPAGSLLTQTTGPLSGYRKWNQVIEQFCPLLTVSGHDHISPIRNKCWHVAIHHTTCVNVGQVDNGPLRYCLIEAEFPTVLPCLPTSLVITALPLNQTIVI